MQWNEKIKLIGGEKTTKLSEKIPVIPSKFEGEAKVLRVLSFFVDRTRLCG